MSLILPQTAAPLEIDDARTAIERAAELGSEIIYTFRDMLVCALKTPLWGDIQPPVASNINSFVIEKSVARNTDISSDVIQDIAFRMTLKHCHYIMEQYPSNGINASALLTRKPAVVAVTNTTSLTGVFTLRVILMYVMESTTPH